MPTAFAVNHQRERFETWLNRPLSNFWCVLSWCGATTVFVGLIALFGGPIEGDAPVSLYSTWAVAHGHLACAYSPLSSFHGPSNARPYTLIAPLYPLVSGALLALSHLTNLTPFPNASQLGANCSTSWDAIYHWALQSNVVLPSIRLGYLSWLALMAGAVSMLRACGRGRRVWEPLTLLVLAILPPVLECLVEFFHPQDLLAVGLSLGFLAAVLRGRWALAGVLVGLAFATNQFVALIGLPIVFLAPNRPRIRYIAAVIATVVVIELPMIVITSGRITRSLVVGSGFIAPHGGTLLWETNLKGAPALVLARVLPIIATGIFSWWAAKHFGGAVLEPVTLISVVATTVGFRLIFEVNLWGYYFTAITVLLVLMDVANGHFRRSLLAWLALLTLAFDPVPLATVSVGHPWNFWFHEILPIAIALSALVRVALSIVRRQLRWHLVSWVVLVTLVMVASLSSYERLVHPMPVWFWQIVLVPSALWLAASPLIERLRDRQIHQTDASRASAV